MEAYADAGIDLIDTDCDWPLVDIGTLFSAYEELGRIERNPGLLERFPFLGREELGIAGDGPWPVLLPGYIFHSMARTSTEIRSTPYRPVKADRNFPHTQEDK